MSRFNCPPTHRSAPRTAAATPPNAWIRTLPRPLPGLESYHVVCARRRGLEVEVAAQALALGEQLARARYGRAGGFVVLMSGGAGRRRDWPHAHVVAVRSVAHKRVCLALLLVKRRLGVLQRLRGPASPAPV